MQGSLSKLLVVESQGDMLQAFRRAFAGFGFTTYGVATVDAALKLMKQTHVDVLVFDPSEAGDSYGHLLDAAASAAKAGKLTRSFALCRFPYDHVCQRVADRGDVKIISLPLPMADVLKAIQVNLSLLTPKPDYKEDVNTIIQESVAQMLGFYLEKNLVVKEAVVKQDDKVQGDYLAVIPMCGQQYLGTVAVSMDREFCLAVARAMLGDTEGTQTFTEHEMIDIVSELSNQLAGILQEKLLAKGWDVNIGMPHATQGKNLRFVHPGRNQVAEVTLSLKNRTLLQRVTDKFGARTTIEFCFDEVG